jgi:hypothetical protein
MLGSFFWNAHLNISPLSTPLPWYTVESKGSYRKLLICYPSLVQLRERPHRKLFGYSHYYSHLQALSTTNLNANCSCRVLCHFKSSATFRANPLLVNCIYSLPSLSLPLFIVHCPSDIFLPASAELENSKSVQHVWHCRVRFNKNSLQGYSSLIWIKMPPCARRKVVQAYCPKDGEAVPASWPRLVRFLHGKLYQ